MRKIGGNGIANMTLAIWVMVGASLILALGGYFGGAPSETAATGTVISTWSSSGPFWAAEVNPEGSKPGKNGNASSENGGLFRVRFPFHSDGWYKAHIRLLNLGEVSEDYEDFSVCIGAAPAAEEQGQIVQDREMFLEFARSWQITRPACSLLTPDDPHAEFDVDPLFGTVIDTSDRSMNYPGASDPVWRVLDIGVVEGGFRSSSGGAETPLRLHLSVEPN